jgi:putative ATP-dependent endonuclease of OLD family
MAQASATRSSSVPAAPVIRYLRIDRFRGIKTLLWYPTGGVNIILGGGDVGKTTVLDAIALLLAPTNSVAISDTDYFGRDIDAGFVIEAVLSLPPSTGINEQTMHYWPWHWDGTKAVIPSTGDTSALVNDPVYCLRVRGTAKHDLAWEIVQPDGTTPICSVDLRRGIGLVRLTGDDRNDRDLRLVQGSALDRLLSDKGLRSRLASGLAKDSVTHALGDRAKEALSDLDTAFKNRKLPGSLDLAITGGPGFSVTALIGLTADREGVQLPLASWGAGTRRMAALAIAEHNQGETPITVVDEIERGLEPYRQQSLIKKLLTSPAQVFVTTHSPAIIAAAAGAALWYVDYLGKIGSLDPAKVVTHRTRDPETFLARLAVVAEGVTEVGFSSAVLEKAVGGALDNHGIYVTNGDGHDTTLDLLEALAKGGLRFAGFADNEGKFPTRWAEVAAKLGPLLFRWTSGCLEENIIRAVPDDSLPALLTDPLDEKTGMRCRALAERLGIDNKTFAAIQAAAGATLKALIIAAALGDVPVGKEAEKKHFKGQTGNFFKSVEGGRELADKMFSLGLWPTFKPQLMPFCNAVRKAVDLPEIPDIGR